MNQTPRSKCRRVQSEDPGGKNPRLSLCWLNSVGATLKMKDGCLIYSQEQNIIVGRSFTGVYVNDIAAPYYEFTDDDEIAAGLRCDGGRDLGIDFGYWKNGCLHIFQTKYIGNGE